MDEEIRLQARELLLRSRIYRFVALLLAVIGLAVFGIFYFKYIDGNISSVLQKPTLILMLFLPFLPAVILSRMSAKTEKKFNAVLETLTQKDEGSPRS